jgi:hypothetical protein
MELREQLPHMLHDASFFLFVISTLVGMTARGMGIYQMRGHSRTQGRALLCFQQHSSSFWNAGA